MTCDDAEDEDGVVCPCCERVVARLHLMEWDGPLAELCSDCADGAAELCDEDEDGDGFDDCDDGDCDEEDLDDEW